MTFIELSKYNKNTENANKISISTLNILDNVCSYKKSNSHSFINQHETCTITEMFEKIKTNEVYVVNLNIFQTYFKNM